MAVIEVELGVAVVFVVVVGMVEEMSGMEDEYYQVWKEICPSEVWKA